MACALTSGRTEPCKDAIGGIKNIFLFDFVEDSFTITAGEATAIDAGVTTVFKYECNADGNTLEETFTADNNNGTSTYEQVVNAVLKKQTKDSANELNLIVKARPVCVVEDRMGNYRVVGISDGTTATGSIVSGGTKADFNGYNLTLTATETQPAPYLDSATVTAFLLLVSGTNVTP